MVPGDLTREFKKTGVFETCIEKVLLKKECHKFLSTPCITYDHI